MSEPINDSASKKDDSLLALAILGTTAVLVVLTLLYLWRSRQASKSKENSWKQSSFSPPVERSIYLEAKKKLDISLVPQLDELKKHLMRRAVKTIPILLSLQNEGSSIERLYKRGMLTDDMHFKVKELKAFVDQEFQDIQLEAEDLVEGWGQHVWPQAMQFHQMIQKQTEAKSEEIAQVEEEKKKSDSQKRREKEKAKKALKEGVKSDESVAVSPALPVETDPAILKAEEAERMAKQLLEEEEAERNKAAKKGTTSGTTAKSSSSATKKK